MPLVGIYWSIYVILIWFKRSGLILTDICNGLITPDIWKHIWSEYVIIYRPILYYIDWYMKISIFYMVFRPIYAWISKIKTFIYRSKNEKFRHISIKISFLKKIIYRSIFHFHISVNISFLILTDICLHIPFEIPTRLLKKVKSTANYFQAKW